MLRTRFRVNLHSTDAWKLSDSNGIRSYNHVVNKRTLYHLVNYRVIVYKLSGCRFESLIYPISHTESTRSKETGNIWHKCIDNIITKCFTICWSEHVSDTCTICDFSIDFRCFRERIVMWKTAKFLIFHLVTLVTHFVIVMVVLLEFHGQKMCQGHHPGHV